MISRYLLGGAGLAILALIGVVLALRAQVAQIPGLERQVETLAADVAGRDAKIRDGARALGLPEDWRGLPPGSVDCTGYPKPQRFLVQSLVAYGWCRARSGAIEEGLEALAKAIAIDPSDGFGVKRIAAVIERGGVDDED